MPDQEGWHFSCERGTSMGRAGALFRRATGQQTSLCECDVCAHYASAPLAAPLACSPALPPLPCPCPAPRPGRNDRAGTAGAVFRRATENRPAKASACACLCMCIVHVHSTCSTCSLCMPCLCMVGLCMCCVCSEVLGPLTRSQNPNAGMWSTKTLRARADHVSQAFLSRFSVYQDCSCSRDYRLHRRSLQLQ